MTAATPRTPGPQQTSRSNDWEWFWRFLAVVMVVVVAWIVWIAIQISPPETFLPAAYEAAAKARAAHGVASPLSGAAPPVEASPHVPPHSLPLEPPVNVEKLKVSDSISTPIQDRGSHPATPAAGAKP